MNFVPFRSYKSLEILKLIVIAASLTTFIACFSLVFYLKLRKNKI
jgi:type IV secretory pathway component VirB8